MSCPPPQKATLWKIVTVITGLYCLSSHPNVKDLKINILIQHMVLFNFQTSPQFAQHAKIDLNKKVLTRINEYVPTKLLLTSILFRSKTSYVNYVSTSGYLVGSAIANQMLYGVFSSLGNANVSMNKRNFKIILQYQHQFHKCHNKDFREKFPCLWFISFRMQNGGFLRRKIA